MLTFGKNRDILERTGGGKRVIPKIIHYIWLGGKELPQKFCAYREKAQRLMPDYEIKVWTEENFDFSDCPYAVEAYERKKFGFVSDYIRVAVLEQYGGIYLDTDVEVLCPFNALLGEEFFTGFENDAYVQTAVLGSIPHHPLVQTLLNFYRSRSFLKKGKPELIPNPLYFTFFLRRDYGLRLKSEFQRLEGRAGSVTAYDRSCFAPVDFTTGKEKRGDFTFAAHRFANSWSGKSQRMQQKLTRLARYLFGRRIFAAFTRAYTKRVCRKLNRELKKRK